MKKGEFRIIVFRFRSHKHVFVVVEKKFRRIRRNLIKYLVLSVCAIALFAIASDFAEVERGYRAFGGEYLCLLIPLLWAVVESIAREFINGIKKGGF